MIHSKYTQNVNILEIGKAVIITLWMGEGGFILGRKKLEEGGFSWILKKIRDPIIYMHYKMRNSFEGFCVTTKKCFKGTCLPGNMYKQLFEFNQKKQHTHMHNIN